MSGSKVVGYVDGITAWWPPTAIAGAIGVPSYSHSYGFNVINLSFWTSQGGPVDAALVWANALNYVGSDNPWGNTTSAIQKAWIDNYHAAGVKVLVSAFGSTDMPTSRGANPTEVGNALAQFVRNNNLDGVDLDWEDTAAFNGGTGEDWLITITKLLRANLPQSEGYLITHAPQAPYFSPSQYPKGAYLTVHAQAGDLIDFYNIQYYNQGSSAYTTYSTLFEQADGWATKTAVREIIASGVPANKVVVGKPVTPADVTNTGYVSIDQLSSFLTLGTSNLGWTGGAMGWQFSSDSNGSWSTALASVFRHTTATPTTAVPASHGCCKTVLTVVHQDHVKRITLPTTDICGLDFEGVVLREVRRRVCDPSVSSLFWVDDEGDVCVVSSGNELDECVRVCAAACLPVVLFSSAAHARTSTL